MIILRPENFGGIAFNTENAHQLWLDQELFNNFKNQKDTTEVKAVLKELDPKRLDLNIITIPQVKNQNDNFPFPVLSSPVLADINITDRCNLCCPHCYVNSQKEGKDISVENFRLVLEQCQRSGVLQIALGGGEPTLHPHFNQFLKEIRQAGIIPNVTTNGKKLTFKTVYYLAQYAGAVALSLEETGPEFEKRRNFPFRDFIKSVKKLKAAGIKLVFQITLSKENLPRVKRTINYLLKYQPYGILFLTYKPAGRGKNYDAPLALADLKLVRQVLNDIFKDLKNKTKIGFDCCITPALTLVKQSPTFKGCSAARESVAIMPDLQVLPCSFLANKNEWDNLRQRDLIDIWQGNNFDNFRKKIQKKTSQLVCQGCHLQNICLGGCPAFDLAKCDKL